MIGLCVTLGEFPRRFLKSSHTNTASSGQRAFSCALEVVFLLLTSYSVCHARLSILYRVSYLIDLTLNVYYYFFLVCVSKSSFWFLNFCPLALVGFLLLYRILFFTWFRFSRLTSVSQETLWLVFGLVVMYTAAASMWTLTKFSYSSLEIGSSDISWCLSNWFLTAIVYLLLMSLF